MTITRYAAGIGPLLQRYRGFLLDQWGVLHNGSDAYPGVVGALLTLREAGKRVVIVSNSGKRAAINEARLTTLGIRRELYDSIMTSGEAAWLGFGTGGDPAFGGLGRRCLLISRGDDRSAIRDLPLETVAEADAAEFVWLAGLDRQPPIQSSVEAQLQRALRLELPLVCTNPDVHSIEGNELGRGPGALAQRYRDAGGDVRFVGKPWPAIYRFALRELAVPRAEVLAVGDSLDHDIQGAAAAEVDSALVTGGIHRDTFANRHGSHAVLGALDDLLVADRPRPDWLLPAFAE